MNVKSKLETIKETLRNAKAVIHDSTVSIYSFIIKGLGNTL